jgi:hypothetical protein
LERLSSVKISILLIWSTDSMQPLSKFQQSYLKKYENSS